MEEIEVRSGTALFKSSYNRNYGDGWLNDIIEAQKESRRLFDELLDMLDPEDLKQEGSENLFNLMSRLNSLASHHRVRFQDVLEEVEDEREELRQLVEFLTICKKEGRL